MKANPYKFGTIVEGSFFTDREDELEKISSYIKGENHLIMISPRRYGKTSLIKKVLGESGRKYFFIDLQVILSAEDMAAQLLKRVYRIYPVQKLKNYVKTFRIIPVVNLNPVTGQTEISFKPDSTEIAPLEDVLNLIEKIAEKEKEKIIVVFDEFQEIFRIGNGLDRFLRSVMQTHRNINYIFLGSSESMIRNIFEKKGSPFYRFGSLMLLGKIPFDKFIDFLQMKFKSVTGNFRELSESILKMTACHPFYTQQLAFTVWELLARNKYSPDLSERAAKEIVQSHDNDYERIWNSLNKTDMVILAGISLSDVSPLSDEFSKMNGTGAVSTVFSTLQRLTKKGMLIKEGTVYSIDDPFFKRWIILRRQL